MVPATTCRARRIRLITVFAVVLGFVGTACSAQTEGTARTPGDVGGLPITHFESGPRAGADDADIDVENADHGEMDRLAINSIADLYDFWGTKFPEQFDEEFEPVNRIVSYDAEGKEMELCRSSTKGQVNAFYCPLDDSIAWDRGTLLPALHEQFGPMAPVTVLAHEMGHAVQFRLKEKSNVSEDTPTIVTEQQADCYAGSFFRWMAEGKAKHFRVSTGDGLNRVLGAMFLLRDEVGKTYTNPKAHGTAFDRVFAFQAGFTKGVTRCAQIDESEIEERITEKPFHAEDDNQGNVEVNTKHLDLLKKSLDRTFERTGAQPPEFRTDGARCASGRSTAPVTYCPDDNTIAMDIDRLNEIAEPPARGSRGMEGGSGLGDFAAFAEIASRYTLSIQDAVGATLDNENAGLRSACLTGAWAQVNSSRPEGNTDEDLLLLSSGDLDEAIAEMLSQRSLIASDVEGRKNASAFAMVDAFRTGYVRGSRPCTQQYG